MKFIKKLKNHENPKINALFRDITSIEYILICIPFTISMVTTRYIGINPFGFVFTALIFMLGFGFLFLMGLRWRIIYFMTFFSFSILLFFVVGKPLEYWIMADRDSAIRVGIEAILNGNNPYKARTSLGHTPSPLPFTFILYLPVYLITLGHTFFMNVIIMSIFFILLLYNHVDTHQDYLILPIMSFIIISDWFFQELGMNSDLMNVGLILCMVCYLIPNEIPKQKKFQNRFLKYFSIIPEEPINLNKRIITFAILFGCLLAMRIFIWLIGIIIAAYILKNYGIRNTIYLTLISICVFIVIILPFMLQDINYFMTIAPIGQNSNKFAVWRSPKGLDFYGVIIVNLLKLFLSFGRSNSIIISVSIMVYSLILGLLKCQNKLHLFLIISFCFLIFLFFCMFSQYYGILQDYVSIAAIPFIFSFLYIHFDFNTVAKQNNNHKLEDSSQ